MPDDALVKAADAAVARRLRAQLEALEDPWERHHGVADVQQPDLGELVRRHILHELSPDLLPRRPPRREIILDDPLLEELAGHRAVVLDAEAPRKVFLHLLSGRRGDAVYHTVRESAVGLDPLLQVFINRFQLLHQLLFQVVSVMRNVVARHHGDSPVPGCTTSGKTSYNVSHNSGTIVRLRMCVGIHKRSSFGVVPNALHQLK
mmetsp:Transcript_36479/g.86626  ORF Transcript_36479/g.86626 Transcript_36479/m.86626 type:complete len:204 (-) Transcript_36479:325-936(-)